MGAYCQQCSQQLFDADLEDLAGFVSPTLAAEGYGVVAQCAGCGPVMIDPDGRRLDRPLVDWFLADAA